MLKPTTKQIADAMPLTEAHTAPHGPFMTEQFMCGICGQGSDSLALYRECDVVDKPYPGDESLIFIGRDHAGCMRAMDAHPRLYIEESGNPGNFPALCGECTWRVDLRCEHPDQFVKGGPGLLVELTDPLRGAIVCGTDSQGRRARIRMVNRAVSCAGQEIKGG
jgi:hypothetical protein